MPAQKGLKAVIFDLYTAAKQSRAALAASASLPGGLILGIRYKKHGRHPATTTLYMSRIGTTPSVTEWRTVLQRWPATLPAQPPEPRTCAPALTDKRDECCIYAEWTEPTAAAAAAVAQPQLATQPTPQPKLF